MTKLEQNKKKLTNEEKLIKANFERHNDAYNFGKVKGNSINTNVTLQDSNIQQAFNEMKKDLEVLRNVESER